MSDDRPAGVVDQHHPGLVGGHRRHANDDTGHPRSERGGQRHASSTEHCGGGPGHHRGTRVRDEPTIRPAPPNGATGHTQANENSVAGAVGAGSGGAGGGPGYRNSHVESAARDRRLTAPLDSARGPDDEDPL